LIFHGAIVNPENRRTTLWMNQENSCVDNCFRIEVTIARQMITDNKPGIPLG
jgi:hypothetical protein